MKKRIITKGESSRRLSAPAIIMLVFFSGIITYAVFVFMGVMPGEQLVSILEGRSMQQLNPVALYLLALLAGLLNANVVSWALNKE